MTAFRETLIKQPPV